MPFEPWKEETPHDVQEEAPPEPVAEPEARAPKPEPEAAPEPEASVPEPARKQSESVPYERFRETLGRAKEAEARLQEALKRLEAVERPKEPEVKVPAYEEDPLGHLRQRAELTQQQLAELRQREQQQETVRQQMAERDRFVGWYRQQATDFSKERSDFGDAYQFTMGRMRELVGAAVPDPQAAASALEQWEAGIALRAASEGKNPAAALYDMAKMLGYAPAASAPKAEDKVASLAEAKERSKSLGPSRASSETVEEDDDMGGLRTLFEAQAEMGLRRKR